MQKRVALITSEFDNSVCSTGFCILRLNNNVASYKYIYHLLGISDFYRHIEENQEGSSYPAISNAKVMKYRFYLPSLEEQERIVKILDKLIV